MFNSQVKEERCPDAVMPLTWRGALRELWKWILAFRTMDEGGSEERKEANIRKKS